MILALFLSSCKWKSKMKSQSPLNLVQLQITVLYNEFLSVSVLVFSYTHPPIYTSKDHLNFTPMTKLQHCENNSIAKH